MGDGQDHFLSPARIRATLTDFTARWWYASERDKHPAVVEARANFATTVQRWFRSQADWLKHLVLVAAHTVTVTPNYLRYLRLKKYKAGPNDPPCLMLIQTVNALAERFGAPRTEGAHIIGWHINDRFDIIVQKDQNWGTYIWLPWPIEGAALNGCTEVYNAGRGRNRGTYTLPSLCRGQAALKIKVVTERHLEWAINLIDFVIPPATRP